jgi:hypothetical protein
MQVGKKRPVRVRRQANSHRPGIAPALGLRAVGNGPVIVSQTASLREIHTMALFFTRKQRTKRPVDRRRSFVPRLECLEDRTVPSTLTVTNNLDGGAGSLRDAIQHAKDGDTIAFAASLDGQTITLTSGELAISKSLDIEGPGAGLLAVSGNNASRVFNISQNQKTVAVTIAGLTIENGRGSGTDGGGILNVSSTLTLNNDILSDNVSEGGVGTANAGGGISNRNGGTLTVSGCTFSGNEVIGSAGGDQAYGGAIANGFYQTGNTNAASTATVTGCMFSGNLVQGGNGGVVTSGQAFLGTAEGGAIMNQGPSSLTVTRSTFIGNQAIAGSGASGGNGASVYEEGVGKGGAIANIDGPTITVSACSFSHNQAIGGSNNTNGTSGGDRIGHAIGGALMTEGSSVATIMNSTFDHNQALGGNNNTGTSGDFLLGRGGGGAIGALIFDTPTTLTISNCTFTNNSAVGGNGNTSSNPFTGDGVGGALMNERGTVSSVAGCKFTDNQAVGGQGGASQNGANSLGGAVANILGATLTISGSTFTGNEAVGGAGGAGANGGNGYGGVIFNDGFSIAPQNAGTPATLKVTGSTISSNQATGGAAGSAGLGVGGGVYFASGGVVSLDSYTVANIFGNTASTSNDDFFGDFTTCS